MRTPPLRRAAGLLLATASALLLSGCISLDLATSVSPEGTFTGEYELILRKDAAAGWGLGSAEDAEKMFSAQPQVPEVEVSWRDDGGNVIRTVAFTDATAEQIDEASRSTSSSSADSGTETTSLDVGFPLRAQRRGDSMLVVLAAAATDEAGDVAAEQGLDKQGEELLREFLADSVVKMAIRMPGSIDSVRGAIPDSGTDYPGIVVEQTQTEVQMEAPLADLVRLAADSGDADPLQITSRIAVGSASQAPPPLPSPEQPSQPDTGSFHPGILLGLLGALAAAGVLAALLMRRRGGLPDDMDPPGSGD